MISACLLGGCTFDTPPRITTEAVRTLAMTDRTDSHLEVGIDLDLYNPTEDPIQLERFAYTLDTDAGTAWTGSWSALRTIPPMSRLSMRIPAVLDNVQELRPDVTNWTLTGDVSYKAPGRWAQILFDTGFRRPTADFTGAGLLIADEGETPAPTSP